MKFIGIDYGTKRVGIALSDSTNKFAIPHVVLPNSKRLIDDVNEIVCEHAVTHVVIGESKNFKGQDNEIMVKIRELKERIENVLDLPVMFEPEFLTSHQAEHPGAKRELIDASAAAIILQSYLDRLANVE